MEKELEKAKEIAEKVAQVMTDMVFDYNNNRLDNDKLDIYAYTLDYYGRKLKTIRRRRETIMNREKEGE